jgi:hypothetical protein
MVFLCSQGGNIPTTPITAYLHMSTRLSKQSITRLTALSGLISYRTRQRHGPQLQLLRTTGTSKTRRATPFFRFCSVTTSDGSTATPWLPLRRPRGEHYKQVNTMSADPDDHASPISPLSLLFDTLRPAAKLSVFAGMHNIFSTVTCLSALLTFPLCAHFSTFISPSFFERCAH